MHEFSESIRRNIGKGMKGQELVNEVVMEWKSVVNRVAEFGEKMIVGVEQLGGGVSRSKTKLTQDGKYRRRLLMVSKHF